MIKTVDIAVVGATGEVGRTTLAILHETQFPIGKIYPLASERSEGSLVDFGGKNLIIEDLAQFDFKQVQLAFFSVGADVAREFVPIAVKAGCVVIDKSSAFRYETDIPLIVPEVNSHRIKEFSKRNIIANPNCSTIQMVVALKPIYDAVGISRVTIATYQSVSGAGQAGTEELAKQCRELLNGRTLKPKVFQQQIAFNVLPHIDAFQENGYTLEEMKLVWETQKIFEDDTILVNPTAVRVPVFYGHSEAITIETKQKITVEDARKLLQKAQGVKVIDDISKLKYPTPITHGSGTDAVYVGRIREDLSNPLGLNLWVVSDNVRKGAALNAVQIARQLVEIL